MRLVARCQGYLLIVALLSNAIGAAPVLAANATDLAARFTAVSFRNGSTGLYTTTITNNGPAATNDPVTVNLTLPAGFYFISGGNNGFVCAPSDTGVACVREVALASGTSTSLQIRAGVCSQFTRVSSTISVVYANDTKATNNSYTRATSVRQGPCLPSPTATATRSATPTQTPTLTPVNAEPTRSFTVTRTPTITPTATPSQTPIPASADLKLTKLSVGQARVGQNHTYSLSVANLSAAATNVPFQVIDTLPSGLAYSSFDGVGWTCSASGQVVACTYSPALPGSSTVSLTLVVGVSSAAYPTVTNRAVLSYGGDPDTTNNTASRPTTVRQ